MGYPKGSSGSKKQEHCLRINLRQEPSSLDPRRGRDMTCASQVHAMLFEGLMRLEPSGKLVFAQAESYEVSADLKTYTFHLRASFWSDGTPVTSGDFEKTWKQILDPAFLSNDAHLLYCIKNARAANKGEIALDEVGIYAQDVKTLIVVLEHPNIQFLHITASSVLFPVNQTKARQFPHWHQEAGEHFVSNGPFKLSQWEHHELLLLEKNRFYHAASKIKLNAIHISMINNGTATLHLYASGLFDVIGMPFSPLPFDLYRELTQKNLLHIVKTPGTVMGMFNTHRFPFHNKNIRKAFAYALNRQELIDTITLLKEEPALGLIPPMLKHYPSASVFSDDSVGQARAYLQKGMEELGITLADLEKKITFSFWKYDHGCPMLPQALQKQWLKKLKVKVEIEALDFKALHDKGRQGLFSMGYFVCLSMYSTDPIELLERFKYAHNVRNYARWENKTYIELLDKSARSQSQDEHFMLIDQAEKLLMDEMPLAPIFYWNYALLIQPYVKGFAVSPLGYLCFDRISIEIRSAQR